MRRWFVRGALLVFLVLSLACSFFVDLSGLGGDAGKDASFDASLDVAQDQVVEAEASSNDAALDAGPDAACSSAKVGNTTFVLAPGSVQVLNPSGPIVSGDYVVSKGFYFCFCSGSPAAVVGGVHITVNGANIVVERRIDFSYATVQINRLDRWHGTFDQINQRLNVTEDCPEAGASSAWYAYVAIAPDGGSQNQIELSFPDVRGANPDSGTPSDLALILTKL